MAQATKAHNLKNLCLSTLLATAGLALFMLSHAKAATKPKDVLEALFDDKTPVETLLAPGFLAQIPARHVQKTVDDIQQRYGPLRSVKTHDGVYILHFDAAKVYTQIMINPNGLIRELWFFRIVPAGSIHDQLALIKNLPGKVSYLIRTNSKTIASKAASTPMAVGSTFKLAVLLAVREAVDRGSLAWDEVVALNPAWTSLPSGQLQDWPEGTPVTIATLTNLMISLSDNTATDALIHLVGRGTIEHISPHNRPFLTTREAFLLKSEENDDLRRAWNKASEKDRRRILKKLQKRPLSDAKVISRATPGVEWFMTAEEICDLLEAVHDMPSLSINSGPIDRAQWRQHAYKGGSEFGVLNLSGRVVGTDGTSHCIVATWNDDISLDNTQLLAPYQGIIDLLHSETAD